MAGLGGGVGEGNPLRTIWHVASINRTLPSAQHSTYLTPMIDCSDFISWAYRKSEFEETVGVSTELVLLTLQNLEQGAREIVTAVANSVSLSTRNTHPPALTYPPCHSSQRLAAIDPGSSSACPQFCVGRALQPTEGLSPCCLHQCSLELL